MEDLNKDGKGSSILTFLTKLIKQCPPSVGLGFFVIHQCHDLGDDPQTLSQLSAIRNHHQSSYTALAPIGKIYGPGISKAV